MKLIYILLPFFVLIDQYLKYFFYSTGKVYINSGISFSLFNGSNLALSYINLILLLILFILLVFSNIAKLPLYLIFIGGISNIIDRFIYGGVVDYINFGLFYNNIADIIVTIGVIVLCYKEFLPIRKLFERS